MCYVLNFKRNNFRQVIAPTLMPSKIWYAGLLACSQEGDFLSVLEHNDVDGQTHTHSFRLLGLL